MGTYNTNILRVVYFFNNRTYPAVFNDITQKKRITLHYLC